MNLIVALVAINATKAPHAAVSVNEAYVDQ